MTQQLRIQRHIQERQERNKKAYTFVINVIKLSRSKVLLRDTNMNIPVSSYKSIFYQ